MKKRMNINTWRISTGIEDYWWPVGYIYKEKWPLDTISLKFFNNENEFLNLLQRNELISGWWW